MRLCPLLITLWKMCITLCIAISCADYVNPHGTFGLWTNTAQLRDICRIFCYQREKILFQNSAYNDLICNNIPFTFSFHVIFWLSDLLVIQRVINLSLLIWCSAAKQHPQYWTFDFYKFSAARPHVDYSYTIFALFGRLVRTSAGAVHHRRAAECPIPFARNIKNTGKHFGLPVFGFRNSTCNRPVCIFHIVFICSFADNNCRLPACLFIGFKQP